MPYYTGIGSRETPPEVVEIMEDAGFRLARIGYTLRSGKAAGADAAFQRGAQKYHESCNYKNSPSSIAEIYIPWKNFKGGEGLIDLYDITLDSLDKQLPNQSSMRWDWVKEVHDGWGRLSQGARKLHERNIHQIFGPDLENAYINQSKFVLYYAQETKSGKPKGGTATAVNMAKKTGIRVLNLLQEDNRKTLDDFLTVLEEHRGIR